MFLGRGEARTIPCRARRAAASCTASACVVQRQEEPRPGDAVHTARSTIRQRHSGLADNLDRATCKITAQGFPTSTAREERLSTKTNTFHLQWLTVLLSLN